jgi:hypothetical protein
MEGYGAEVAFRKAKEEGLKIAVHVQDGDSSASKAVKNNYPNIMILGCGGHESKNHRKHLESFKNKKSFTSDELKQVHMFIPELADEALEAHCMCSLYHKANCGCFTDDFIRKAGANLFHLMKKAGTSSSLFATWLRNLALYHSQNIHKWDGGKCGFHAQTVCSCGGCDKDTEHGCEGKPYQTSCVLTCPYHKLVYILECYKIASKTDMLIHPILGKVHTNQVESSHSVLLLFRSKNQAFAQLAYEVYTNLGLLQSNLNFMYMKYGPGYHWLPKIFERMALPVYDDVVEILKEYNQSHQSTKIVPVSVYERKIHTKEVELQPSYRCRTNIS